MTSVIRIPAGYAANNNSIYGRRQKKSKGINLGFCRVCTCINMEFLTTKCALLKLFEIILGSCCETLLIRFGMAAASDIGEAFFSFHSTVTTCLTTSIILSIVYFFSANSYDLMKQTVFEIFFNSFACFLYASSSMYMGFASNLSLYPRFISSSSDAAFPALVSVYYIGAVLAICYGMDAYTNYKIFKSYK